MPRPHQKRHDVNFTVCPILWYFDCLDECVKTSHLIHLAHLSLPGITHMKLWERFIAQRLICVGSECCSQQLTLICQYWYPSLFYINTCRERQSRITFQNIRANLFLIRKIIKHYLTAHASLSPCRFTSPPLKLFDWTQ